jgi:uncharacterized protein
MRDRSPADAKWGERALSAKKTTGKRAKGPNPKIVFGLAILFFVVAIVFVRYEKRQQSAYDAEHPALTHYVLTDQGPALSGADNAAMEDKLAKLDKDGAAQAIVVLNYHILSGAIADDALAVARRYRVGHAGKNDGVVLLIASEEKKARIEVGYGLEGVLTDAQSRLIIADDIEPYLAKGDVAGAANHGRAAILAIVHPAPFAEPVVEPVSVGQSLGMPLFMLIPVLIAIGILQAILLAIPSTRMRILASKRWGWFGRIRILGGSSRDNERGTSGGSSSSGIGGGGSFGGGGAND